jgi:hypothetical protein
MQGNGIAKLEVILVRTNGPNVRRVLSVANQFGWTTICYSAGMQKNCLKKKSSQYSVMRGVPWKSDDYSAGQEISCLHGN